MVEGKYWFRYYYETFLLVIVAFFNIGVYPIVARIEPDRLPTCRVRGISIGLGAG
jgi:hypothetical protein